MIFLMILRNKLKYILIEFSIYNFYLLTYEYHYIRTIYPN